MMLTRPETSESSHDCCEARSPLMLLHAGVSGPLATRIAKQLISNNTQVIMGERRCKAAACCRSVIAHSVAHRTHIQEDQLPVAIDATSC